VEPKLESYLASVSVCDLHFDRGTLVLKGVHQAFVDKVFPMGPWIWDERIEALRCDACQYHAIAEQLTRSFYGQLRDGVFEGKSNSQTIFRSAAPSTNKPTILRTHQLQAVEAWMQTRRGCLVMPTGTGKTEVAIELLRRLNTTALIVAPVRDLMYQWHRRLLERTGYDAGILGDNLYRLKPITITTYDSAYIHAATVGNQFQFVIYDECHHLPGPQRSDAARMMAAPFRLGLTATIERRDGRHRLLDELIGPVVYRQEIDDVRGTIIADFDIHRIAVTLTEAEQARYDRLSRTIQLYIANRRREEPAFSWRQLCREAIDDAATRHVLAAFQQKQSMEDRAEDKLRVLEDLFCLHHGEPILVFTGTNVMAREISIRFLVPCILSHTPKHERLEYLKGLEAQTYPVLVANRVLDEGVDLPDVKVAIVLGGTSSHRQSMQRLGRILRPSPFGRGTLYEIVTRDTREVNRSRQRRRKDVDQ
jgi:superfamily II DNA or RNA helicase